MSDGPMIDPRVELASKDAQLAKLRAALTYARDKLRTYGSWDEPSAMLLIDLADTIDEQIIQKEP